MKPRAELTLKTAQSTIRWEGASGLVGYDDALKRMDQVAAAIRTGAGQELVWLAEHPPLYTAGTSAKESDLLDPKYPVHATGRGGQYTYHGPGQRIAYVMLDLRNRGNDVRAYVSALEHWIILTLAEFGVTGERREDRVGVWVRSGQSENKIAAIGIRVRGGVTMHGISINVDPDLSHYDGIIACGVKDHGVTSLRALGLSATMAEVDHILKQTFGHVIR